MLAQRTGCQFVIQMTHEKIADNQFKQYSATRETLISMMMIDEERGRWWNLKGKEPKGRAQNGQGGAYNGNAVQHLSLPNSVPSKNDTPHPSFHPKFHVRRAL